MGKRNGFFEREFVVNRRLGRGGQGEVYECKSRKDKQKYAVKIIALQSERLEELALREIDNIQKLNKPSGHLGRNGIVKYYDAWIEGGGAPSTFLRKVLETLLPHTQSKVYIQMELCTGGTLAGYRTEFSAAMLNWCLQIARAVDFMHSVGYMHRDLKPSNIFVTSSGQVKVGDYGLAKYDENGLQNSLLLYNNSPGVGTDPYRAPEVLQGKPYNEKCDIYSLGIILMQKLGQDGFDGRTMNDTPRMRPSASQMCQKLEQMLKEMNRPTDDSFFKIISIIIVIIIIFFALYT